MPNPTIPTCADRAGDEIVDYFDDMVNPPACCASEYR